MATSKSPSDGPPRAKALLGDLYDWGVMDEREGEDDHRDAHIGQILRALYTDLKGALPPKLHNPTSMVRLYCRHCGEGTDIKIPGTDNGYNQVLEEVHKALNKYFEVE